MGSPSESRTRFRCAYCGAWLDLRYHFCLRCATPYREPGVVYDDPEPLLPSLEERLRTEGRPSFDSFCILAVGLVVLGGLRAAMGREYIAQAIILQEVFLAAVTITYAAIHRSEILPFFRGLRWTWVLPASLPLLAILLAVNKGYHDALTSLFDARDDDLSFLRRTWPWPALIATICVFPGFFEELAFRGFIQERLSRAAGPWPGILVSSVLFVTLHFTFLSAPYLFLLSVFLGWVRLRTASIYPSMVLHFLHNLGALVFLVGRGP